jgi:hypothetical protein
VFKTFIKLHNFSWAKLAASARLGAPPETQLDLEPRNKRARTEDSTMSTGSGDAASTASHAASSNGVKLKASGAAALRPNEIAMEQIAGKKRSKFWVYAVEPVPGAQSGTPPPDAGTPPPDAGTPPPDAVNGASSVDDSETNGRDSMDIDGPPNGHVRELSLEGSLSPL